MKKSNLTKTNKKGVWDYWGYKCERCIYKDDEGREYMQLDYIMQEVKQTWTGKYTSASWWNHLQESNQ